MMSTSRSMSPQDADQQHHRLSVNSPVALGRRAPSPTPSNTRRAPQQQQQQQSSSNNDHQTARQVIKEAQPSRSKGMSLRNYPLVTGRQDVDFDCRTLYCLLVSVIDRQCPDELRAASGRPDRCCKAHADRFVRKPRKQFVSFSSGSW